MAATLGKMKEVQRYAVASRNQEKAQAFANEWGFEKAYGSYEELANDPQVDLIYIATPHAMHYNNARMCIEKGKPVLCEKAFTANARQAEELLSFAHEKKVFITEANLDPIHASFTNHTRLTEKRSYRYPLYAVSQSQLSDKRQGKNYPSGTGRRSFTRHRSIYIKLCSNGIW